MLGQYNIIWWLINWIDIDWVQNYQNMDSQESSTYLEEFISSTEILPNDIRRNFELIRELDKDSSEYIRRCDEAEVYTLLRLPWLPYLMHFYYVEAIS